MGPFELLKLPLRAPMISVLFVVAVVMGHQWSMAQMQLLHSPTISLELLIAAELFQLLAVLVICTMPCLLYTSPSPRDATLSRMPSSA